MSQTDTQIDTRDPYTTAMDHLNRGIPLTQADQAILDRNGDGAFDERDRQRMKAERDDTAFNQQLAGVGRAAVAGLFLSEGAMQINAPGALLAPFTRAATDSDATGTAPTQSLTARLLHTMLPG